MKTRKVKDLKKTLKKKGFEINPSKKHHEFYYLMVNGKKSSVYTYFSHGKNEYGKSLMGQIKKQLKFSDPKKAEDFFDCPMTENEYLQMLKDDGFVS